MFALGGPAVSAKDKDKDKEKDGEETTKTLSAFVKDFVKTLASDTSEKEFRERIVDTPISEIAIVGVAAGLAHMGARPVCEMQFIDFISNAYSILTNV